MTKSLITQDTLNERIKLAGDKLRLGHYQAQEAVLNLLESGKEFSEAKQQWIELHGSTHKWREHVAEQLPDIKPESISHAIACYSNPELSKLTEKNITRVTLLSPSIFKMLGSATPEVTRQVIDSAASGNPMTARDVEALKRQAKAEAKAEADREKQDEIARIESELADTKSLLSEVQSELSEYHGTCGARDELSKALRKEQDKHSKRLEQDTRKHQKQVMELEEKAERLQRVVAQSEQALSRLNSELDEAGNVKRDVITIRESLKNVSLSMASQFAELDDLLQDEQPTQLHDDWHKFADRLEGMVGAIRSRLNEHYPKLHIVEREVNHD